MKKQLLTLLLLAFFSASTAFGQSLQADRFFDNADGFFGKYVTEGLVDYSAVIANPKDLNALLDNIQQVDLESLSKNSRKAFLINTYNLFVIKKVVDNYPIKSPQDVPEFFKSSDFKLFGGLVVSLDKLEKEILDPSLDGRVHFALVCAAKSCPPLQSYAYRPDKVNVQLEKVTREAINDPEWMLENHKDQVILYPILFDWYETDFTKEEMELIDYINGYRTIPLNTDYDFEDTYPYDWTLNDVALAGEFKKIPLPENNEPNKGDRMVPTPAKAPSANKSKDGGKSNVQTYTPSVLLGKDQIEIKLFNNLYSQTAWFDSNGDRTDLNGRSTFHTTMLSVLLGTTESQRMNFGFDISLKGTFNSPNPKDLPTDVFTQFGSTDSSRWDIGSLGPKFKIQPFKNVKRFSVQSAFWIPTARDPEGNPWLDWNRLTWWNQFFYDKLFGDYLQLFAEADVMLRFPTRQGTDIQLFTPTSLFVSTFPTGKSTLYAMFQYAPTFEGNNQWYYAQYGFGGKYQLTKALEIELLFTDFFMGEGQGAGETYNIGLRYLR